MIKRSPELVAVPPEGLVEFVASTVRDRILSGDYTLGSRLDQRRLAETLGVSVVPVREGLRVLQAEGLMVSLPNRGLYVATLSTQELSEIFSLRELLDPLAVQRGAERMDAESILALESIVEQLYAAITASAFDEVSRLSRQFHFLIYAHGDQPVLYGIVEGLRNRSAVYARFCVRVPGYLGDALVDHEAVMDACRSGDGARAAHHMKSHVQRAATTLLAALATGEESP